MLMKKLKRRASYILANLLNNKIYKKKPSSPPIPTTILPEEEETMENSTNFHFPATNSTVLPDPSVYFSPHLLSSPLPTNSFFQNFVLKNGDQPEYIHPYLIKSTANSVSLSYPTRFPTPNYIYQTFSPDLTITTSPNSTTNHVISSFDDLSVTLDLPPSLRFFLVRGSPFLTFTSLSGASSSHFSISSSNSFVTSSNSTSTKHTLTLSDSKKYIVYSSSPINLSTGNAEFFGVVRIAYVPDDSIEPLLDRFASCYPVSGRASFRSPFSIHYAWEHKGYGDLLLLAHPLHLRLLERNDDVTVLPNVRYRGIDGDLVGVVARSWTLKVDPVSVAWHSARGVGEDGVADVVSALRADVDALKTGPVTTASSYFYGKAVARAARFALIGEEVGVPDVVPVVRDFLKANVTPWLEGSFNGNGFLYDPKWGGIVTRMGSTDSGADFGFGIYNDHHYHLGYFLYAIAVLAKIDPAWGRKYRPQAYAMMADFMTLSRKQKASYTRLRCFDLWKLHSWAGGLTEFGDGRNQESTSEAVNAYYSAALMGMSYGDTDLVTLGSTLAAFEIAAAETWWHVREGEGMYEDEFSQQNKLVGVLWNNKRDSGLWFAPAEWKECRLGIQVLPLLPITEYLFRDVQFVQDLVKWTMPALSREGVGEGWKGFVYALEAAYDKESALQKTKVLSGFDDGNSLSNMLWWIYSRADEEDRARWEKGCWFRRYCH